MVQITSVQPGEKGVAIEYLTNGITISTLVKDTDSLTPQEIAEKGYDELRPYIDMELNRLRKSGDHTLPEAQDEIIRIELLGVMDLEFTEGQQPIDVRLRCTGHTKYGKAVDLRNEAAFSLVDLVLGITVSGNRLTVAPQNSCATIVYAKYGSYTAQKEFSVRYIRQQPEEYKTRVSQR
jgi:hypothetical protein